MNEPDTSRLTDKMREAVDAHPVEIPDLLPAAQRSRSRRRVLGGAAATVAALALVGGVFSQARGPQQVMPAAPAEQNNLTTQALTERCTSQIESYGKLIDSAKDIPAYIGNEVPASSFKVTDGKSHSVGDVVSFTNGIPQQNRFCVVPEQGQTIDPLKELSPTTISPKLLGQYMTQILGDGKVPNSPDLSDARLVSKSIAFGHGAYIVAKDGKYYGVVLRSKEFMGESPQVIPIKTGNEQGLGLATEIGVFSPVDKKAPPALSISLGRVPSATKVTATGQFAANFPAVEGGYFTNVTYLAAAPKGVGKTVYTATDGKGKVLKKVDTSEGAG